MHKSSFFDLLFSRFSHEIAERLFRTIGERRGCYVYVLLWLCYVYVMLRLLCCYVKDALEKRKWGGQREAEAVLLRLPCALAEGVYVFLNQF